MVSATVEPTSSSARSGRIDDDAEKGNVNGNDASYYDDGKFEETDSFLRDIPCISPSTAEGVSVVSNISERPLFFSPFGDDIFWRRHPRHSIWFIPVHALVLHHRGVYVFKGGR